MAPKVRVPADFGRRHIGAPSHGNLTFNLLEGTQIKANSIIMSLNSPVIDDLTTNLHLTSLEADDFSRDAVDCFIEASYTGEIEALNAKNFRDVYKISHVFKVNWLMAKCEDYFVSNLDNLDDESSHADILFFVEEAVYLLSALKNRVLLNLVTRMMSTAFSSVRRATFITEYLADLGICSQSRIDACIYMVKSDSDPVLLNILIAHLKKQEFKSLDANSRRILRHTDLADCLEKDADLHSRLFAALSDIENIGKEDYQLFVDLHKQVTCKRHNPCSVLDIKFMPCSKDFFAHSKFETAFFKLASNPKVDSLYSFFDWLWIKLYQYNASDIPEDLAARIVTVKEKRGWSKMDYKYVEQIYSDDDVKKFIDIVKECDELVFESEEVKSTKFGEFIAPEDFVEKYFCQNSDLKFQLSDAQYANNKFAISTAAMLNDDPDTFSMKLELLESKQHVSYQMPKLHIALERRNSEKSNIIPLSWCGKPTCDKTKTYWNWGYVAFYPFEEQFVSDMLWDGGGPQAFHYSISLKDSKEPTCRCRIVSYLIE